MWQKFLNWWKEINQAGKLMDAYRADDYLAREPFGTAATEAQQKAQTDAMNWASTKVGD